MDTNLINEHSDQAELKQNSLMWDLNLQPEILRNKIMNELTIEPTHSC